MGSYTGYALVGMPQPRNRLENGRGTDDEMSRGVWKKMEKGKTDKARMAEVKRERRMERERKEERF